MMERSYEQNALVFADICGRLAEGMRGGFCAGKYEVPCCCYVVMEDFDDARDLKKGWLLRRPLPVVGADMMFEQLYVEYNGKWDNTVPVSCVRPYLRRFDTMTNEEWAEYCKLSTVKNWNGVAIHDFMNRHMIDYRGLIEKGLALPAPDGMYHFETPEP